MVKLTALINSKLTVTSTQGTFSHFFKEINSKVTSSEILEIII